MENNVKELEKESCACGCSVTSTHDTEFSYYSKLLNRPFDTFEELVFEETVFKKIAAEEKAAEMEAKQAEEDYKLAVQEYDIACAELTQRYEETLEAATNTYELAARMLFKAKAEYKAGLDAAEAKLSEAKAKYPTEDKRPEMTAEERGCAEAIKKAFLKLFVIE